MRLAAIASALAIIVGAAIFGAILSQETSIPVPAHSYAVAAAVSTPVPETVGAGAAESNARQMSAANEAAASPATTIAPLLVAQASPKRAAPAAAPAPEATPAPTPAAA